MTSQRHLLPKARELLDAQAGSEERIAHIKKPIFVPYPRGTALLNDMEELLKAPKSSRPPNLLIIGRSNNGKTQLLREFMNRHRADERPSGNTTFAPVVFVQAPPTPSDRLFLDRTLRVFNIEARRSASDSDKLQLVLDQLRACETKVLLIDELHSILAGPVHRREAVLNTFKYLSNESGVSIVAAGTLAAREQLLAASELASRFDVKSLTKWSYKGEDFRKLLWAFETALPLHEPSNLQEPQIAKAIFGLSDECIGGAARVVRDAAIAALKAGQESITLAAVEAMQHRRDADKGDGERI